MGQFTNSNMRVKVMRELNDSEVLLVSGQGSGAFLGGAAALGIGILGIMTGGTVLVVGGLLGAAGGIGVMVEETLSLWDKTAKQIESQSSRY
ncbi:MAG: hypothetical protein LBF16_04435 [Pseudomonadales bacterium]|jgi:hypothetical protein|nr:hypothetical protein [Pseudomonadales bacterium]